MLNDISIYMDTSFYKLGEFDIRKFAVDVIKRLDKATLKSEVRFEWDVGSAVIFAKGITKANELPVDIEEAIHWTKVEQFLERWMHVKKREITVQLILHYKKADSNDMDSDPEEVSMPKGKKVQLSENINCRA